MKRKYKCANFFRKTVQKLSTGGTNSFYKQRNPVNLSANGVRCFIVI